jgi:hypothetical protein
MAVFLLVDGGYRWYSGKKFSLFSLSVHLQLNTLRPERGMARTMDVSECKTSTPGLHALLTHFTPVKPILGSRVRAWEIDCLSNTVEDPRYVSRIFALPIVILATKNIYYSLSQFMLHRLIDICGISVIGEAA